MITLQQFPRRYFNHAELAIVLGGSKDSQYSKVKRLLANKTLIRLKREIYLLQAKTPGESLPHPFEIAQFIEGPSFISLESALSFHGLIPERVHTITSASTKRTKNLKTPLGYFAYHHLPQENFYTQVSLVKTSNHPFLIATPWRAICDYIYCYKKNWVTLSPLTNSLRIELSELPTLTPQLIDELIDYYHHSRITRFLTRIKKELNQFNLKN